MITFENDTKLNINPARGKLFNKSSQIGGFKPTFCTPKESFVELLIA